MGNKLVIFGGSKGIGHSVALKFKQEGFQVLNFSRSSCSIADRNILLDLTDQACINQVIDALNSFVEKDDELSIIHNAFKLNKDSAVDMTPSDLNKVYCISTFVPTFVNQWASKLSNEYISIIYTGSTLSEKAVPGAYSYCTFKHAAVGQMRSLCQDSTGSNIHTAMVCPGFTETEMLSEHLNNDAQIFEQIKDMVTFKRLINPDELAPLYFFIHQNRVTNGSIYHANLGQINR